MSTKLAEWAESLVDYEKVDPGYVEDTIQSAAPDELTVIYVELIGRKRDVEAQMSEKGADLDVFQNECLDQGDAGKAVWFRGHAAFKVWKAKANRYKTYVEALLAKAKIRLKAGNIQVSTKKSDGDRKECFKLLREAQVLLASNDTARDWRERTAALIGKP